MTHVIFHKQILGFKADINVLAWVLMSIWFMRLECDHNWDKRGVEVDGKKG